MTKQVLFDADGRKKLMEGMDSLARAVQATLGPTGKNVILEKKFSTPLTTKDGSTVAKEVELVDPFQNMGAKFLNEVASRTGDNVGDGTTTSVVLAQRMLEEGRRCLAGGVSPVALRRGIEKAVDRAVKHIQELAKPVKGYKEVREVALVSSNFDEELADLLAEAMERVGENGVITIEENKGTDTYLDVVQGMQFDKGYISPYFVTDPQTLTAEIEDPWILFFEKKLGSIKELVPLLEKIVSTGKPLVIVAEDVEGEALAALVINKLQGVLKVVAVKAPGFGDRRRNLLEDMAILTGGQLVSDDLGTTLEQVTLESLGSAAKVIVEKEKTTIIKGKGTEEAVQRRVDQMNAQMEQTTSTYDQEKLTERKAKLAGGIGILYVGGHSEIEMKERKDRADDALHATRAAVEEGIVPGGGLTFLRAIDALEPLLRSKNEEGYGAEIVREALEAPLRRIAENSGRDGGDVLAEVLSGKGNHGFDAKEGKFCDLLKAGIVDPAKVAVTALQNAASAAGLNLSTDVVITEVQKNEDPVAGATT